MQHRLTLQGAPAAAAVCLLLAIAPPPVAAALFEGTFSGIAFDSRIDATSPNPRDFDGEVVTGSFRFDTADQPPPESSGDEFSWTIVRPGSLELVFHAAGRTVVFGSDSDDLHSVFLFDDAQGQRVDLNPFWIAPYHTASLVLSGPLFDGVDLQTLRPGPVNLEDSIAYFFDSRDFGASIDLTSVSFVPEPHGAWLLLAGLGALAARSRRHA